jgi:hypothetical protein
MDHAVQLATGRRLHQAPPASSVNFTTFRSAADGRRLTVQDGNLTTGGNPTMAACVEGSPAQLFSLPRPAINMLVYVGGATNLCVRSLAGGVQVSRGSHTWVPSPFGEVHKPLSMHLCPQLHNDTIRLAPRRTAAVQP